EEEAPRRSAKPVKKGTKKEQSGKGLLIGLIAGGVVLLLGGFALGAWVWPGFLKSSDTDGKGNLAGGDKGGSMIVPKATGKEDLMAYLPADSNAFGGVDVNALKKLKGYKEFAELVKTKAAKADADETPPEALDLIFNAEKILAGGNLTAKK